MFMFLRILVLRLIMLVLLIMMITIISILMVPITLTGTFSGGGSKRVTYGRFDLVQF